MGALATVADPTGYRVFAGLTSRSVAPKLVLTCDNCPTRNCDCFYKAIARLRCARHGHIETFDGVVLASMRPTTCGKPVRMLSLEEHRAQPRRVPLSVDEVADEDDPLEEPTDEPGGDDGDESVDDAGEVE